MSAHNGKWGGHGSRHPKFYSKYKWMERINSKFRNSMKYTCKQWHQKNVYVTWTRWPSWQATPRMSGVTRVWSPPKAYPICRVTGWCDISGVLPLINWLRRSGWFGGFFVAKKKNLFMWRMWYIWWSPCPRIESSLPLAILVPRWTVTHRLLRASLVGSR